MACHLADIGDFLHPDYPDVLRILESLQSISYPKGDWIPSFDYMYTESCRKYVPYFFLRDTPSTFDLEDVRELARDLDKLGLRITNVTMYPQDSSGFLVLVDVVPVGWLSARPNCYPKPMEV